MLGGLLLFAGGLFLIGNRRMLFADTFVVYTELQSLAGLQDGGIVRVAGMDAGEVKDIQFPLKPGAPFRLRLGIRRDLAPMLRADSTATVRAEGMVGAQYVHVTAGSEGAPAVGDGGTIPGRNPVEFADLLQQLGDTIGNVDATVKQVTTHIESVLGTIDDTANDAHALMLRLSDDTERMAESTGRIIASVRTLLDGVARGEGTVGRMFKDDEMYRRVAATVTDAQQAVAAMRRASEQARDAMTRMNAKDGPVESARGDLARTLATTRDSMQNLRDATEAIKHNFLLRGFFKRRGYFNLAELSPGSYRSGVLATEGRRALRIWLGSAVLFEATPDGGERLTDQGKQRLDSAMAAFIEYREEGPLVVEGYAPGADESEAYLRSRRRAVLVREYLLNRFELDGGATGQIALGMTPPAGADQDRWDGVALALYVKPRT